MESLAGTNLFDLVEPAQRDTAGTILHAVRTGGQPPDVSDWTVRRTDGEDVEVEVSVRDLRHEPTVAGLVLTLRDVTERRRLERELLRRAYLDPLTGLGNRLQFQDTVQRVVDGAAESGATAGVLVVNIDDFRVVNDTMGHGVGDELLIAIGERLTAAMVGHGSVARLGADEFGAVVDAAQDAAQIEWLAWKTFWPRSRCRSWSAAAWSPCSRASAWPPRPTPADGQAAAQPGRCRAGHGQERGQGALATLRGIAARPGAAAGCSCARDLDQAIADGDFIAALPTDRRAVDRPSPRPGGAGPLAASDPRA